MMRGFMAYHGSSGNDGVSSSCFVCFVLRLPFAQVREALLRVVQRVSACASNGEVEEGCDWSHLCGC